MVEPNTREERLVVEAIQLYKDEMTKNVPQKEETSLFNYHKLIAEIVMDNIRSSLGLAPRKDPPFLPSINEAIGEAFMDVIDLNWEKCEEICRETMDRVENRILSDENDESRKVDNYWSLMKRLQKEYNADIGEFLCSLMLFIRLEYLDDRQDTDFDIMMEEIQKQATESSANAAAGSSVVAAAAAGADTDHHVGDDAISDGTSSTDVAEASEDGVLLLSEDDDSQKQPLRNASINADYDYGITPDLLRKHRELLKDRLQDTEFGILDKLLANDSLTHQEMTAIRSCSSDPYVRSERLIDAILVKNIVPEFIQGLVDTGQLHLVNYLRRDGVYSGKFGDVWPLTDDLIKILNVNHGYLIDTIDPSHIDLVGRLLAVNVINTRQFNFISEERGSLRKNTTLLSILRRRSVRDYRSTAECLIASNQKHVAEILTKGGVVIKLRFSQRGDPQTVHQTEETISNQMLDLLRGLTIEETQKALELTQLKVCTALKGESIYLYVYCASLEELTELQDLLVTGSVKTIVEDLFNKLVSGKNRIVVSSCTYSEDEYNKCKLYFEVSGKEDHFEKELKLRMTWGRVIIFWKYWIDCRRETIDVLNSVLDIFEGEVPPDETNPVQVFLEEVVSQDEFDNFPLQFAHIANKDFSCYKVLLRKLTEFLDLVTSGEYLDAFGVEPKDLFFNISNFQTNIATRQPDTCRGFEICENIISREQDGLGETAKLLTCTSRPLFHFKDLLRKLYDEGRLNQAGLEDVINDLQQEETDMSTMFSESLLTFLEVSCKVNDAVELLRMDIGEWLPKREKSITTMKEIIEKLNKTTKDVAITQTVSSSVGIVGGAIAIGGLIFAPFTLGASLIPAAIAGGVVSGLGAATAIGAAVAEIFIDKGEMEKAMTCIEEDKVLLEEVAKRIENLNRNSTMLLRYIPQDELESLISVMTDPQSTAMVCISAKSQVDPRIAINVARLVSIGGKAVVMPVSRLVIAGTIAVSRVAVLALAHSIAAIGVALDIANLVLASVKLGKGAKSENAEKLEEVLKQMEEEKGVIENCLAEMS